MEAVSYLATILGITLPALIGFFVIGAIVVGLVILGGELYSERDKRKSVDSRRPYKRNKFTPRYPS
jgi:hypothetical protein